MPSFITVVFSQSAETGATRVYVDPVAGYIPAGSSGTYTEPLIDPPYAIASSLDLAWGWAVNVEVIPYALSSVEQAIETAWGWAADVTVTAGATPPPAFDADQIVVNTAGDVVTSNGFVVATSDDAIFNQIVVDSNGDIVTSNGFVVSTSGDPVFDQIAVDSAGRVVTSNGFVVLR
jgi:hypothetical protein